MYVNPFVTIVDYVKLAKLLVNSLNVAVKFLQCEVTLRLSMAVNHSVTSQEFHRDV